MRAAPLLLAAFLLGAPGAGAQLDPGAATPEDQVASRIREALRAPQDRGAWAGLAEGLANLGTADGNGLVGMRAAVRIADSLAFAPDLTSEVAGVGDGSVAGVASGFVSRLRALRLPTGTPVTDLLGLPALLSLVLASWFLLRGGRTPRILREGPLGILHLARRLSGRGRSPASSVRTQSHGGRDPRALALSLVETGMPASEVARRTGMAQDEVSVLLAIRRSRLAFGGEDLAPRKRSA